MAYNFKSIADVEVVETPTDTANVLIEEDGVIKKAPKNAVGGGEWDAVIEYINTDDEGSVTLVSGDYQTLYNKIMVKGEPPNVMIRTTTQYGSLCYSVERTEMVYVIDDYINIGVPNTPTGDGWKNGLWFTLQSNNTISL